MMQVLYEDNHLIVVVKEAGILSQGDQSGSRSIMDDIKDYISEKYQKPGNVYLGLVHRLDRNVAGIMVFARTSKAASRLSEAIRNRDFDKGYTAFVSGEIPLGQDMSLTSHLRKDARIRKAFVFNSPQNDTQEARLTLTPLSHRQGNTEVKINLETGRFHQIRAQLSHIGHPIVGDTKYGAERPLKDRSIKLFCTHLSFDHPTSKEGLVFDWKDY